MRNNKGQFCNTPVDKEAGPSGNSNYRLEENGDNPLNKPPTAKWILLIVILAWLANCYSQSIANEIFKFADSHICSCPFNSSVLRSNIAANETVTVFRKEK